MLAVFSQREASDEINEFVILIELQHWGATGHYDIACKAGWSNGHYSFLSAELGEERF